MNKSYKFKNVAKFIFDNIGAELFGKIKNNHLSIAVLGNCKEIYDFFVKCGIDCKYYDLTKKNWKSVIANLKDKNNMPKFDVIVGNPPYEGKGNPLYLQILEKCNECSKTVIWLCPTQWVKNYKDNEFMHRIKYETCKNLIFHKFIGNPFDNALTANEVGIFVFGENTKYENFEQIRLERFINAKLAKSIWDKFEKFTDNLKNHVITNNDVSLKGNFVNCSRVRGNQDLKTNKPKWDWTTLFGEEQHVNFDFYKSPRWNHWCFDTKNECKNFIAYTETDILMFAYYIAKLNNNQAPEYFSLMPWLGDYTKQWTENEIAKKLNLTKEEVEYIHQEMANFGWKAAPRKKNNVTVPTVPTIDKEQINKLNAKAMVMRKTFTAKQKKIYHKMFDGEWAKINKRIDLNKKLERSLAFAKARISCAKKVLM